MPDFLYLPVIEGLLVVVTGFVLLLYVMKLRGIMREERSASDIMSSIVTSLEGKIEERDERLVDLLFRVDLLETRLEAKLSGMDSSVLMGTRNVSLVGARADVIEPKALRRDVTSTEMVVLNVLVTGAKTPKEIQGVLGKSREHVARVMRDLFEAGYVSREERKRPFVYTLTVNGKNLATAPV